MLAIQAALRVAVRLEFVMSLELQDGQKGFLGNVDFTYLFHPLLPLFLLLEQLPLSRDVAAVALRGHVFAHGPDRFTADDLRTNRGLDGHFVLLSRDEFFQFCGELPTTVL